MSDEIKLEWHNERRKIKDLVPHPNNPRKMSEEQVAALKKSLEKFNLVEIPAIDTDNTVIAGHQRLKILMMLGRTDEEIDVRVPNRKLTADERDSYLITSNKVTGEWDWGDLANFSEELLLNSGFSKVELNERLKIDVETEDDKFDAEGARDGIENAITQLGDLYEIGPHKILCGDSTDPQVINKLMNGEKANCVFTDPPYNVDYNQDKFNDIHKTRKAPFVNNGRILNDKKTPQEFEDWLQKMFKIAYENTTDDCPIYVCHSSSTYRQFIGALEKAGWHWSQNIIWLKERIILAMGQEFHRIYEPIMYGWKEGKKRYSNFFINNQSELWDLDKLEFAERLDIWYQQRDKSADYDHPTQKPVQLAGRAIRKSCPPDGLIFEPFLGSGSTMMAAHQLNRKCYGVELDPAYVDVEIRRMLKYAPELVLKKNGVEITDKSIFMMPNNP